MKTIEIKVPDDVATRIERAASARGISLAELVTSSVNEKLERDAEFESAAPRVLQEHAELYRRLS